MLIDYQREFEHVIETFVEEQDRENALDHELLKILFFAGIVTGYVAVTELGKKEMQDIMGMAIFQGEETH